MDVILFLVFAIIAVVCAINVVVQSHPISSAISLVGVMGSLAVLYLLLGAEFIAAAQVIVYAGAIMVLFIFVIMMLNLGADAAKQESRWLSPGIWMGPSILALVLLGELVHIFTVDQSRIFSAALQGPKQVGIALFGPYVLGVELASLLLLAGLIGAYHLGRPHKH